jgi:hypothetical protein
MCIDDDLRGGRFVVVVVVVVARLLMDAVGVNARATAKPVAARSNRIRFMACSDLGAIVDDYVTFTREASDDQPSSLERKSGGNEVEVGSQMQRP